MEQKFCQSSGMLFTEKLCGTNADRSKNDDYCTYCYKDSAFTNDCIMEEMIESCANFMDEANKNMLKPMIKEEYKDRMQQYFPMPTMEKMIRKNVIILLATFVLTSCSDPNTRYVKKAVHIMDRHGIYAQGPEWEKAKQDALSALPSSIEEAQEIVIKAGKVAGGKHTFLMTTDKVVTNDTAAWETPTVKLLEYDIASIKLPAFSSNAEKGLKYAKTVLNAIPNGLKGIIIDLRGNRGGNMYPMIAAVHRFLPDDVILKFSSRKRPMNINTDFVVKSVGIEKQAPINCPVALLTDGWTGSSGEAVLICFRGLTNTRSFGSPTAGYASCNRSFGLPDGSQLVLTTGEDIARTGEVFCDNPIEPDVLTKTPFEDALEWIKNTHDE